MGKPRTIYTCSHCGYQTSKWFGRCGECKQWAGLVEQVDSAASRPGADAAPVQLSAVRTDRGEVRLRVGISELDRCLGGGLVAGSLTLLGGDPGVGKSTLLLMALDAFAKRGLKTLYVSAEESALQVRLRAERLGIVGDDLYILADTDLDKAIAAAEKLQPAVVVLDSVQTLYSSRLDGVPGAVTQVREVASKAMAFAKGRNVPTFLVGHVTKQGGLAGPKTLEHLVDTVIYFEGEGRTQLRCLRSTKNRFGSTGELGFFEMTGAGLAEVPDASARLLAERCPGAPGTAVISALEGTRAVLAEIQALVGRPTPSTPTRKVVGLDKARLSMVLAVLGKCGMHLHDRDVFLSAAGGIRLQEPATDLAVAAAVASSLCDKPIDKHTVLFGEVGLAGEVRSTPQMAARLREAHRHGFTRVIAPQAAVKHAPKGLIVTPVRSLAEALAVTGLRS
jgi:DNA repair protein RadA/Sms